MNLVTFVKGFVDFDDDKLAYLKSQALQQAFTTRESGVTHPFVKSTTYSLKKWPTFVRKVWVDVFDQQPWGNDRIHDPLVIDRCDVINYIPGQYLNWHIDSTSEEQHLESLKIENIEDMADSLFLGFKELNYKKIILKRPIKGEKICNNINYQIKGKSTRFDIYI